MRKAQMSQMQEIYGLIGWWLNRMRGSPNQLREKMTLFWHGHFTTSLQKVREPFGLWQQNETLRQNALGNFGTMTKAIARDPAMIFYLDTQQNHKNHPNENFARELMELSTLGIGNYTEQEDIQQAESARSTRYKAINPADDVVSGWPISSSGTTGRRSSSAGPAISPVTTLST